MSLKKQAFAAPKYVLHTNEFGFDMYIANDGTATDNINDALQFSVGFDNQEIKTKYYSGLSGYSLKVKFI